MDLKQVHNCKTAGHLGVTKTLYNVRHCFYWPWHRTNIRRWCHRCKKCNMRKPKVGPEKSSLKQEMVGMPWEWRAMDIIGPLPKSNSGNLYILLIEDYFTKWRENYALKDHTAQTIADVLVNQWICWFRVPWRTHTDQGREVTSLLQEMCHLENEKTRICPQMLVISPKDTDKTEMNTFPSSCWCIAAQCTRAQGARRTRWCLAVR